MLEYNEETNHSHLTITNWAFHDTVTTEFTCLIWCFLKLSNPANQSATFLSVEMGKIAVVFKSFVTLCGQS